MCNFSVEEKMGLLRRILQGSECYEKILYEIFEEVAVLLRMLVAGVKIDFN